MDFLDHLRAQKLDGAQERARTLAEERRQQEEQAARARAEDERRNADEAEKHRRKAEQVFSSLPDLVRDAAKRGLPAAVLLDGFVDERPEEGKPSRQVVLNRRTWYLKGWQIPFHEMCVQAGVPLTLVSEQADVGMGRILRRRYHILAVDLEHL